MKHPFVQALIEMGIYDEYFIELKKYRGQHSQEFYLQECNDLTRGGHPASEIISGSFVFCLSSQGSNHWCKICLEIDDVYNRIKQETS